MLVALYRAHAAEGDMVYDEGGGGLCVVGRQRVGLGAEFEFVCDRPVVFGAGGASVCVWVRARAVRFGAHVAPFGRRQRLMVNWVWKRWSW